MSTVRITGSARRISRMPVIRGRRQDGFARRDEAARPTSRGLAPVVSASAKILLCAGLFRTVWGPGPVLEVARDRHDAFAARGLQLFAAAGALHEPADARRGDELVVLDKDLASEQRELSTSSDSPISVIVPSSMSRSAT